MPSYPTYKDMFEKFTKIVETGNYPKFASVLMDPENPRPYYNALHEFIQNASDLSTCYDRVPEGEKFYDLLAITTTTYPPVYDD